MNWTNPCWQHRLLNSRALLAGQGLEVLPAASSGGGCWAATLPALNIFPMWIIPHFSAFPQSNLYDFCLHFSNGVFTVVVVCLDLLLAVLCGTMRSPAVLQRPGPVVKTVLCSIGPAAFSIEYLMLGVQGKAKLYNHFSLKMNWPVWPKLQECTCFQDAFTGFLEFLHTDVLQTYEKHELFEALAWIKLTDMQNAEAWNKPKVSLSFVGLWWTMSGL